MTHKKKETHTHIQIPLKVCPECNSNLFYFDEQLQELSCKICGLVINAPYNADFVRPELKKINILIDISVMEEKKKYKKRRE